MKINSVSTILLIFLLIYVLSIIFLNWYFKIAYSNKGCWKHLTKTQGDKIILYFPIINTLAFIIFIICKNPNK